jgi:hypothetical protein
MAASNHRNGLLIMRGSNTDVNKVVAAKQLKVIEALEALIEP